MKQARDSIDAILERAGPLPAPGAGK